MWTYKGLADRFSPFPLSPSIELAFRLFLLFQVFLRKTTLKRRSYYAGDNIIQKFGPNGGSRCSYQLLNLQRLKSAEQNYSIHEFVLLKQNAPTLIAFVY